METQLTYISGREQMGPINHRAGTSPLLTREYKHSHYFDGTIENSNN